MVLNDAIAGFHMMGGYIRRVQRQHSRIAFSHKTDFWCLRQLKNSVRDGYYVLLHIREFEQDIQRLQMHGNALQMCKFSCLTYLINVFPLWLHLVRLWNYIMFLTWNLWNSYFLLLPQK
jgi:hypothetical protein